MSASPIVFLQLLKITAIHSSLHLLPTLLCSSPVPPPHPKSFLYIPWGGGLCAGSKGEPPCLEGLSPPPPRVSLRCKAPWHPCMGWVLGSSNCSYNWLAARGRLFKSACSTRARSLFGNFCRGVLKELGKSCKAVWVFFPPFCSFSLSPPRSAPFSGLHAEPAGFEEVVAEQEKRGVGVQGW